MKKTIFLFIAVLFFISQSAAQIDPPVLSVISKVDKDSLMENLNLLSGEKPITLFAAPILISSRYSGDVGNSYAALWLKSKLTGYGLHVYTQDFYGNGQNVFAIQPGVEKPNQHVIICAHYDDMPPGNYAPGADDNGSGTVAVLEAARILSKYTTKYTIVYALWDQEEQGLYGSKYYADQARYRGDSIIAVINLDMIGYDKNNDFRCEIHTGTVANTPTLSGKMIEINNTYSIGLKTYPVVPGTLGSDHASFWRDNYTAVLLIESESDFNVNYHSQLDMVQYINEEYFYRCSKLGIATLAAYAQITGETFVNSEIPTFYSLSQNYPNPFNPSTKIRYSLAKESHVRLVVYDALGREVSVLVNQAQQPNNYEVEFNSSNYNGLSSGIYLYALYTGDNYSFRKMVLVK